MATDYVRLARIFAHGYGLDPNIFQRQISQESGFNPNARSPAGAIGIAQFMPGTAKGLGIDPTNPTQALRGAAKLMASYVHKYGSYKNALIAYNAGPGALGKPLPGETVNYVKSILGGSNPDPRTANPGGGGGGSQTTTTNTQQLPQLGSVDLQALAAQLAPPQRPQVQAPPPPSFTAQAPAVPAGYQPPPAVGVAPQGGITTAQVLQALASNPPARAGTSTVTTTTGGGGQGRAPSSRNMPKGVTQFDGKPVAAWIAPWLAKARQAGWKGSVDSGYRSVEEQRRIYNSGVRPAAKPGQSNHNFTGFPGGAVDVTDAPQLAQILRRLGSPLQWAGAKDRVHFSHPHNGGY